MTTAVTLKEVQLEYLTTLDGVFQNTIKNPIYGSTRFKAALELLNHYFAVFNDKFYSEENATYLEDVLKQRIEKLKSSEEDLKSITTQLILKEFSIETFTLKNMLAGFILKSLKTSFVSVKETVISDMNTYNEKLIAQDEMLMWSFNNAISLSPVLNVGSKQTPSKQELEVQIRVWTIRPEKNMSEEDFLNSLADLSDSLASFKEVSANKDTSEVVALISYYIKTIKDVIEPYFSVNEPKQNYLLVDKDGNVDLVVAYFNRITVMTTLQWTLPSVQPHRFINFSLIEVGDKVTDLY